jgi:multiple sugar transport system permease protein
MANSSDRSTSPVLSGQSRRLVLSAGGTLLVGGLLLIFLSPFAYMASTALKNRDIITDAHKPWLPLSPEDFVYSGAEPVTLSYVMDAEPQEVTLNPGDTFDILSVEADGEAKEWALVVPRRGVSFFIDPSNVEAGLISWEGEWRTLEPVYKLDPQWGNFAQAWEELDFPAKTMNTLVIAVTGLIGTVISSTLVAYGLSRFYIPGKSILLVILTGTIILPGQVTLIPTYALFTRIGWVGTFLPLIVPHFFANAYNVFLLRQYFMGIPKEMDEAAMLDGAGPIRTLTSVILPQAIPALVACGLFHFVWAWNDYFSPLIYLAGKPDLQPISVAIQLYNQTYTFQPEMIQATAIMGMVLPLVIFFLMQRVFMYGVVTPTVGK